MNAVLFVALIVVSVICAAVGSFEKANWLATLAAINLIIYEGKKK